MTGSEPPTIVSVISAAPNCPSLSSVTEDLRVTHTIIKYHEMRYKLSRLNVVLTTPLISNLPQQLAIFSCFR